MSDDTRAHESDDLGVEAGDDTAEAGQSQDRIDRALNQRISRLRAKHERELDQAKRDAVATFRREHALADETLAELAGGKFSSLYGRISELEGQLREHQAREAQAREEKRAQVVEAFVFGQDMPTVIDGARPMVLRELASQLDLDDNGKIVVKDSDKTDPKSFVRTFYDSNLFLLAPAGATGTGSRVNGPSVHTASASTENNILGMPIPSEDQKQAALKAFYLAHGSGGKR